MFIEFFCFEARVGYDTLFEENGFGSSTSEVGCMFHWHPTKQVHLNISYMQVTGCSI